MLTDKAERQKQHQQKWLSKNEGYMPNYLRRWREKNPDYMKNYYRKRFGLKAPRVVLTEEERRMKRVLYLMQRRCNRPSDRGYKYYGGLGIKCLITFDQLMELWRRDNAASMTKPSIDRIDPDKSYTIENCRFIELKENVRRKRKGVLYKAQKFFKYKPRVSREIRSCVICSGNIQPLEKHLFTQAGRKRAHITCANAAYYSPQTIAQEWY